MIDKFFSRYRFRRVVYVSIFAPEVYIVFLDNQRNFMLEAVFYLAHADYVLDCLFVYSTVRRSVL